jgi:hypothetical protein
MSSRTPRGLSDQLIILRFRKEVPVMAGMETAVLPYSYIPLQSLCPMSTNLKILKIITSYDYQYSFERRS